MPSLSSITRSLLARLSPAANASTIEGHRHERIRRVAWSSIASGCSTAVAVSVSFISIPLTVGYLGPERYGIWITISSLLTWLAVTDMGLGGTALVNALSRARGHEDAASMQSLVSTAFFVLCGIAAAMIAIFAIAFPFVPWEDALNARDLIGGGELRLSVVIAFINFALLFPLSLCGAVYAGFQESYEAHAWAAVGHLGTLLALVLVSQFKGGLPLLVLSITASRCAVQGANMMYLFWRRHPEVRPSWRVANRASFRRLAGLGWKYLIQQLANIGMFQSQPILITQFLGPAAVGIYNVVYRILSLPQVVVCFFLMPLVPAYGEARARGDWPWIWRTLWRSALLSMGLGLLTTLPLALLVQPVVRHWISPELAPPGSLIALLGLYTLLTTAVAPSAIFFNGIEHVGSMASVGLMNAAMTIGLAFLLLPALGVTGMAAAMALGYAATNLTGQIGLLWQLRRKQKKGFTP